MTLTPTSARLLVVIQLLALIAFPLSGQSSPLPGWVILSAGIGLAFGIWAFGVIRPGNFSLSPILKENAIWISHGPYRLVRHPMYLAVIMVYLPLLIAYPSQARFMIFILLLLIFTIKALYEEKQLTGKFPGYKAYKSKTYFIIPYLF